MQKAHIKTDNLFKERSRKRGNGQGKKDKGEKNGINKMLTRIFMGAKAEASLSVFSLNQAEPGWLPRELACLAYKSPHQCWGGPLGAGLPARLR